MCMFFTIVSGNFETDKRYVSGDSTVGQKKKRKYLSYNPHYCDGLAVIEFSFKKHQKLTRPPAGTSYTHQSKS